MKKEITSKMIEVYKSNHGDNCPFCGSNQVDVDDDFREYNVKAGGVVVERGMMCMNRDCHECWTEIFELVKIK